MTNSSRKDAKAQKGVLYAPFTQLSDSVLKDERLNKSHLMVYWILCHHMDNVTHRCYPGYNRIAKMARLSKSTVSKALLDLEKYRYIHIERRTKDRQNGKKREKQKLPNVYTVLAPDQSLRHLEYEGGKIGTKQQPRGGTEVDYGSTKEGEELYPYNYKYSYYILSVIQKINREHSLNINVKLFMSSSPIHEALVQLEQEGINFEDYLAFVANGEREEHPDASIADLSRYVCNAVMTSKFLPDYRLNMKHSSAERCPVCGDIIKKSEMTCFNCGADRTIWDNEIELDKYRLEGLSEGAYEHWNERDFAILEKVKAGGEKSDADGSK